MNTIEKASGNTDSGLDQFLQEAVLAHGYRKVLDRLNAAQDAVGGEHRAKMEREAEPRYLLTLPPEQRDRILAAAVEDALPLYDADRARPEAERELTIDLETGDFHDYEAEEDHAA